jgi:hypothetical protein
VIPPDGERPRGGSGDVGPFPVWSGVAPGRFAVSSVRLRSAQSPGSLVGLREVALPCEAINESAQDPNGIPLFCARMGSSLRWAIRADTPGPPRCVSAALACLLGRACVRSSEKVIGPPAPDVPTGCRACAL